MRAVLLGVLFIAACPAIELRYIFTPEVSGGKAVVHTTLEFKGPEKLEFPSHWGDAEGLEKSITNLTSTRRNGRVRVTYDVVKAWTTPPPRADHWAIVEPDFFEFNPQNGLVHREIDGRERVDVRIEFRNLPPGWKAATSFGTARRQHFRGPWSRFNNALFVAGHFRWYRRGGLQIAIRSQWQVSDAEIVARIQKIVEVERAFWRDSKLPYYLVTVSNFAREGGGGGGGAFVNAFNIFVQPRSEFGYDVQALLAHEMFHEWNPYRMGRQQRSSAPLSWFTEGFTRYYQDLLLYRSGMLEWSDYVERVNEVLRGAAAEPTPYTRGAAIALWLDAELREMAHGRRSLDDVMRSLVREGRNGDALLDAERVYRAAAVDRLREVVEARAVPEIPPNALGACAALEHRDIPRFELGFDREALIARRVVEHVTPDSAAHRAGLRDGQRVTRTSVYWNDVSKPVKLTVVEDGVSRAIEYLPEGPRVARVPQFRVQPCPVTNVPGPPRRAPAPSESRAVGQ